MQITGFSALLLVFIVGVVYLGSRWIMKKIEQKLFDLPKEKTYHKSNEASKGDHSHDASDGTFEVEENSSKDSPEKLFEDLFK